MNCEKVKYLLPDFLRGGLTEEEMSLVAQHLHGCRDCPRELASLQQLYDRLDSRLLETPGDQYWSTLLPRVHERVERRRNRVPRWVPRFAFPMGAAALAGAVYLLVMGGPGVDAEREMMELIGEMSGEEIAQIRESSLADNGFRLQEGGEQVLAEDEEVLQTVLADTRNVFSYSDLDVASMATALDDEEMELLVGYLDEKRFVQ